MFGRRTADAAAPRLDTAAPPPAPAAGVEIATRPQPVAPQPVDAGADTPFAADDEFIAIEPAARPPRRCARCTPRWRGPRRPPPAAAGGPRPARRRARQGRAQEHGRFEQLKAAQSSVQVVKEQTEYYHATKTAIYNGLINTIDLSQLAQLDTKTAAEEIRDIVAELVAIKNVSMSVARAGAPGPGHHQRCAGLWPPGAAAGARRHRRHHGQRRGPGLHRSRAARSS
jgi:pilus assembly protein CpaF